VFEKFLQVKVTQMLGVHEMFKITCGIGLDKPKVLRNVEMRRMLGQCQKHAKKASSILHENRQIPAYLFRRKPTYKTHNLESPNSKNVPLELAKPILGMNR
jgi:hypothetical protein